MFLIPVKALRIEPIQRTKDREVTSRLIRDTQKLLHAVVEKKYLLRDASHSTKQDICGFG